ncbi:MAG TPA: F0F1 ATP synthase subunit A [Verrucomicrobiae bacterium]|nr:F0F1 ATP synthase subunit A [Verrucomicrobiae bacterium]
MILICAFVASMLTASAQVLSSASAEAGRPLGDAVSSPAAPAQSAASAEAAPEESRAAPVLFHVGPLPVTNSMVCTWIVAAIILVMVRATTPRRIKEIPSGMQNALEALVEGWEGLMGNILDPRVARWVFPFATTFFIFILISNFVDVLPGVGSIGVGTPDPNSSLPFAIESVQKPFFRPPTADANLTVVMAALFLVMSLYWAVRYNGFVGLFKHIFGVKVQMSKWLLPVLLLLFFFIGVMDLVSILFARPVALAMRLYGNIFAGSTIMGMTLHMKSWLWSIPLSVVAYGYDIFVCLVQAFVFAILVVAFVGTLCTPAEGQSGH